MFPAIWQVNWCSFRKGITICLHGGREDDLWLFCCVVEHVVGSVLSYFRLNNTQFDVDLPELHLDSVCPDLMHFPQTANCAPRFHWPKNVGTIKLVADITEIAPEPYQLVTRALA